MIIDPIAITNYNLDHLEKSKEASLKRLKGAGILDEDGKLAKIYQSSKQPRK
ncbi:hypothetical protein SAMN05720764_11286 [Fibrobacter sp. UWH5]|nr:hypothetical protein SAMN05720764_11286 [Fibrobacter sp. UWH5]